MLGSQDPKAPIINNMMILLAILLCHQITSALAAITVLKQFAHPMVLLLLGPNLLIQNQQPTFSTSLHQFILPKTHGLTIYALIKHVRYLQLQSPMEAGRIISARLIAILLQQTMWPQTW
ncbi:hypothetical protein CPB84DRAFT_150563 [Gymnopilus junonius]|uniref:Uncharacterized protein n=1 Tax=Gymnopilus junonius TaxID=109634 RepID=A0A9P5TJV7_GYMJU|nr:hypothetical protein CPB84DRAFT_150563 [Gymnopilus junonius]